MKKILPIITMFFVSLTYAQVTITDKDTGTSTSFSLGGSSLQQGNAISEEAIASFTDGVTTLSDVTNKLGQPTSSQKVRDMTILVYRSSRSDVSVNPISFVPILGTLFGSTKVDAKIQQYSFMFDSKNILMGIKDMSSAGVGEDKSLIDKLKNIEIK